MDKVTEAIRLHEKSPSKGPWRMGKGIALGNKYSTAPMLCEARIKIAEDEKVVLYHSADDVGMGVNVAMAQIVAEKFGITMDDVKVIFFGHGSDAFLATDQIRAASLTISAMGVPGSMMPKQTSSEGSPEC
jgi:CO/xanthine dehydrogenase Mo-binding subunit